MNLTKFNLQRFCIEMASNLNRRSDILQLITDTSSQLKLKKKDVYQINETYFPNGMKSFMLIIFDIVNKSLREKKAKDFANLKVNEKIKHLTFLRFQILNEIFDKRKLFSFLINPSNLVLSSEILFRMADEIWWLAGDKSTDMNYYSKRIILMNILSNSFTLYAFDNSENNDKTYKFIENQIKRVLQFGKIKKTLEKFVGL